MKKGWKLFAVALIAATAAGFGGCRHQHDYVVVDMKAPTCFEDGYSKSRCSGCDEVLEETLYALGHKYDQYNHCTVCGVDLEYTVMLSYELSEDKTGYYASLGSATANEIVVPAYYQAKPVLGILPEGFFSPVGENATATRAAEIVSVELADGIESIGTQSFSGCVNLKKLTLPRQSLTSIGDYAFYGCKALDTFDHTPAGLKTIGKNAFYGCTALRNLPNFPALSEVGDYAFYGCTTLETAYFGKETSSVGVGVFYGCSRLRFVSLGNSLSIPQNAFTGCSALEEVTVSGALKEIGSSAFSGCLALKAIRFGGTMADWKGLKKADDWFLTTLDPGDYVDYYIYCTDGTLDHNGIETKEAPN